VSAPVQPVSQLRVHTEVVRERAQTLIFIDDVDVLELQRPTNRPDGTPDPEGPTVFSPADPDGLLPPDSASLLPTAHPRQAMIGICECGEPGDSSLWMQVRRQGSTVIWEPDPNAPRSSIDATWAFHLQQYLDAVDEGQRSTRVWENRPRLIARELRRRRDSLFGFVMIDAMSQSPLQLVDAKAWPGVDEVLLKIASPRGVRQLLIAVPDDQTDERFLRSLHVINLAPDD
jgi:hypothetical protein